MFYSTYVVNEDKTLKIKNFCDFLYPLGVEDRKLLLTKLQAYTWSRLLKLEFIKKRGIKFPSFRFIEDHKPHWMVCLLAEKVAFVREHLYYYRRRNGQLTRCTDERRILVIDVYCDIEEYLRGEKIYSLYRKEFLQKKYRAYLGGFLNLDVQFREEFLKKVKIPLLEIFFLLTRYNLLIYGLFLIFLKLPFIESLDIPRRLYIKYKQYKKWY